jgi:acetyl-CoA carboxylase biotin carboxyl carrier protein
VEISDDLADLDSTSLRELLDLLRASRVDELEIEAAEARLYIRRTPGDPAAVGNVPALEPESSAVTVLAPAVGLFHRGTEDGAPPLVGEGEEVEAGQVLAIVEVFRMPTTVDAPVAGTVRRFLVESGQPVEYGQPLVVLAPAARNLSSGDGRVPSSNT